MTDCTYPQVYGSYTFRTTNLQNQDESVVPCPVLRSITHNNFANDANGTGCTITAQNVVFNSSDSIPKTCCTLNFEDGSSIEAICYLPSDLTQNDIEDTSNLQPDIFENISEEENMNPPIIPLVDTQNEINNTFTNVLYQSENCVSTFDQNELIAAFNNSENNSTLTLDYFEAMKNYCSTNLLIDKKCNDFCTLYPEQCTDIVLNTCKADNLNNPDCVSYCTTGEFNYDCSNNFIDYCSLAENKDLDICGCYLPPDTYKEYFETVFSKFVDNDRKQEVITQFSSSPVTSYPKCALGVLPRTDAQNKLMNQMYNINHNAYDQELSFNFDENMSDMPAPNFCKISDIPNIGAAIINDTFGEVVNEQCNLGLILKDNNILCALNADCEEGKVCTGVGQCVNNDEIPSENPDEIENNENIENNNESKNKSKDKSKDIEKQDVPNPNVNVSVWDRYKNYIIALIVLLGLLILGGVIYYFYKMYGNRRNKTTVVTTS